MLKGLQQQIKQYQCFSQQTAQQMLNVGAQVAEDQLIPPARPMSASAATVRLRDYSLADCLLMEAQHVLATLTNTAKPTRPYPPSVIAQDDAGDEMQRRDGEITQDAEVACEQHLTVKQRRHAASLMRINHCGEVCAQALYRGQAWLARDFETFLMLRHAGDEELDHLLWCARRVRELAGRNSILAPAFYLASYVLGVCAAACGDAFSMGFIEETEHQVAQHLARHMQQLDPSDIKTRAIVEQMRRDEAEHAAAAKLHGAQPLPKLLQQCMRASSKLMTWSTRWI